MNHLKFVEIYNNLKNIPFKNLFHNAGINPNLCKQHLSSETLFNSKLNFLASLSDDTLTKLNDSLIKPSAYLTFQEMTVYQFLCIRKRADFPPEQYEINLSKNGDIRLLNNLIDNENTRIYFLPKVDQYYFNSKDNDVYLGDIFECIGEKETRVFVAEHNYTYCELIWCDKYGYYTPDDKINKDKIKYNSHVLTLSKSVSKLGNIYLDSNILRKN